MILSQILDVLSAALRGDMWTKIGHGERVGGFEASKAGFSILRHGGRSALLPRTEHDHIIAIFRQHS